MTVTSLAIILSMVTVVAVSAGSAEGANRAQPPNSLTPSPPLDNIRVMVIVWRFRGNNIRTALCWIA